MKKGRKVWHVCAFVAVFAVAIAIVMLLWNALIPSIIGWSAINFWQAAGLMILCKLLFGGFGRFGMGRRFGHDRAFHHDKRHHELHEKLRKMSSEERREYLRKRMDGMYDEQ